MRVKGDTSSLLLELVLPYLFCVASRKPMMLTIDCPLVQPVVELSPLAALSGQDLAPLRTPS